MPFSLLRFARLAHDVGQATATPPAVMRRQQRAKLRSLVAYAREYSPFYRERLRHLDDDRWKLRDIPPTTKDELRDQLDRVFTDRLITRTAIEVFASHEANLGKWFLGKYAVSHTSGSQGAPLWIVQDRGCLEMLFATMTVRASLSRRPGIFEGLKRLVSPRRIAIVTFRRGFYPSGASLEFLPEVLGPFVRVLRLSSMQPDLIDRLREFQPHVVSSYASVLEALVEHRDDLQFGSLQQITNSSEQLVERARRRIGEAFRVPVIDHYGAGECLWIADSCHSPHGGLHVNADGVIVEVVDDRGDPVPADTVGARILVTNLVNRVQPFLRYELGDRVSLRSAPCDCGSRLPRIGVIEGRGAELFWVEHDDERRFLSGVLFHAAADSLGVIREWQARQLDARRIELQLELLPGNGHDWQTLARRLRQRLVEYGLPEWVEVTCVRADALRADPRTGKMRRMIPSASTVSTTASVNVP